MLQAIQLSNIGLYTFSNVVGQVPPGSWLSCINAVVDKPGVADCRRGQNQFGTPFILAPGQYINKLFPFSGVLLAHVGTTLYYDSSITIPPTGNFTPYSGSFAPPVGDRIRETQANSNFYFTTNNGIYKIDALTNNPYPAGGIPALDLSASLTGASGFLNGAAQCAYQITWVYTDANGNEVEGNPSAEFAMVNATGISANTSVTFTVPSEVTTAYYYRVYRTQQTSSATIVPGNTYQLAIQNQVTSAQIAALAVTVTDVTPDILLGLTLYTSQGQPNPLTNDRPPLARDICTFLGMTFYFNCSTIQQTYVTLISAGAPNGIQINDTITIQGNQTHTYIGQSANNFPNRQFQVSTASTVAVNIDTTARNLVAAINQDPNNSEVYAYYQSGLQSLPGIILLQARNLNQGTFTLTSSRGGAFSPVIPSTGIAYISSNNTVLNGFYVSKQNQPEAVPSLSLDFIGNASQPIYRGYPIQTSLVVETAGGIFTITGSDPSSLSLVPFDVTTIQNGNDTGVVASNSAYSFTNMGVVAVNTADVNLMSQAVKGDLLALANPLIYPNFNSVQFGVSYDSDQKYILGMAENPSDMISTIQYVFNWSILPSGAWSTWQLSVTCGVWNPADNLLYFGGSDGQVTQERKTGTQLDYADRQWLVEIVSSAGYNVVLNTVANAVIGYTLATGITSTGAVTYQSVISAVNPATNTVTVEGLVNWPVGPADIYQPIPWNVTYTPLTCGSPNFVKRFTPVFGLVFGQGNFTDATVSFSTDLYPVQETVTLTPKLAGGWGTFGWGTLPWGVSLAPLQIINTMLTKNCQMAHWLNVSVSQEQCFTNPAFCGLLGFYDVISARIR